MKLDSVRTIRLIGAIVIIILLIVLVSSSVYTVKETEQAVITTFGKYTKTAQAGLQFKLPWPIQSVTLLPVNMTQKIELGYYSDNAGNYYSIPEESMMITGDMNIVSIDFLLSGKSVIRSNICLPRKIRTVSEKHAAKHGSLVVGTKQIDDVLTTEKSNPVGCQSHADGGSVKNDIGLMVIDVKANDSNPDRGGKSFPGC